MSSYGQCKHGKDAEWLKYCKECVIYDVVNSMDVDELKESVVTLIKRVDSLSRRIDSLESRHAVYG